MAEKCWRDNRRKLGGRRELIIDAISSIRRTCCPLALSLASNGRWRVLVQARVVTGEADHADDYSGAVFAQLNGIEVDVAGKLGHEPSRWVTGLISTSCPPQHQRLRALHGLLRRIGGGRNPAR